MGLEAVDDGPRDAPPGAAVGEAAGRVAAVPAGPLLELASLDAPEVSGGGSAKAGGPGRSCIAAIPDAEDEAGRAVVEVDGPADAMRLEAELEEAGEGSRGDPATELGSEGRPAHAGTAYASAAADGLTIPRVAAAQGGHEPIPSPRRASSAVTSSHKAATIGG